MKKTEKLAANTPAGNPTTWNEEQVTQWFKDNDLLIHATIKPYKELFEYDDLYQIARMAALRAIRTYDEKKKTVLSTLVVTYIKNDVGMELRHQNAKKRTGIVVSLDAKNKGKNDDDLSGYDNLDFADDEIIQHGQTTEECVVNNDLMRVLSEAIETVLTPEEKTVVRLTQLENMSQADVAAKYFDCSQAKISSIWKAARQKLAAELIRQGYGDANGKTKSIKQEPAEDETFFEDCAVKPKKTRRKKDAV